MVENNYDILGIVEGSTEKEIRDAFRRLALQFHSDRGGENEQFIKIKQAYDDLKIGKKYPQTDHEKLKNSKVYSGDSEADVRRKNQILGQELFKDGALSIKGNFMAGKFTYDGPIIMQGSITSPSWTEEFQTDIHVINGDFKFINPLENKYKIDNGAKITVDNGNAIVGNIYGRKFRIEDPVKVGVFQIQEHRTHISAPKGKIVAENLVDTVLLEADSVIVLNAEDDVIISAREILFYGGKLTYDSVIELKQGGLIRFFENFSIQGLSGDAIIKLENGKKIRLFDLKTKKIKDLADEFVPNKDNYNKDATMVGHGFTITYDMLDNLSLKPAKKQKQGWASKFGFSRK
jgi:curved DNA-binding protein CbpA